MLRVCRRITDGLNLNILEVIQQEAEKRELSFMVIGGHAVNAHRFSRRTEDLDLLICKTNRDAWCGVMDTLGYSIFHDGGNFLQFKPPTSGEWPVDFMLVENATFDGMMAKSVTDTVETVEMRLPSIPHLVAMKLHAINHGPPHREMGDLHDIIMMLRQNKIDIESKEMQDVFAKHGNPEQYEQIRRASGK